MLDTLRHTWTRLRRDERGASLVEYAMLISLIALVCFGALTFFGASNSSGIVRSSSCIVAAQDGVALPASCQ